MDDVRGTLLAFALAEIEQRNAEWLLSGFGVLAWII